jgi:hypothetical protein
MKNGVALKGHRRVMEARGTRTVMRQPFSDGWSVSCICGWNGGDFHNKSEGQKAYRTHLDALLSGLFKCKRCGESKPLSEMRSDFRYICLVCFSEVGNEWQKRNPHASARHKRNHSLLRLYGITFEEFSKRLAEQDGRCAICGIEINYDTKNEAQVDHDHATGKIRGILCFRCNSGLGSFQDKHGYASIGY